jgi:hypothetical protein
MKKIAALILFAVLITGCDEGSKDGEQGEACLAGGLCNDGLVCTNNVCLTEVGNCGNGILNSDEECDAELLGGSTCGDHEYSGGELSCSSTCTFEFSNCIGGCGNSILDVGEECDGALLDDVTCETLGHRGGGLRCTDDCEFNEALCMPQLAKINTNVDILFVIDDSLSMVEEQSLLRDNFSALMDRLKEGVGYMPNVHIGITTTDVDTGAYYIPSCGGGINGKLIKGSGDACSDPVNQAYIVNVEPKGCAIEREGEGGTCSSSDCSADNCGQDAFIDSNGVPTEPSGLTLISDENGCPRCVNYADADINEVFSCMADVGINGCGFEQPLEAMNMALTAGHAENEGFVRDTAYLAVVIVTDEDDCSVADTEIFNPEVTDPPLNSFRCTVQGIECIDAWNTLDGTDSSTADFSSCISRDASSQGELHLVHRYTDILAQVKGNSALSTISAIAGPFDGTLSVQKDEMDNWRLTPSCSSSTGGDAMPALRIKEVISYYNEPQEMDRAFLSICSSDYSPVLEQIGDRIVGVMGH